jgi:hypothetical protein
MEREYIHHSCKFCNNDWTVEDGFNLETQQCPPCDAWDADREKRDAETKELLRIQNLPKAYFPYMAGDPFW